MSTDATDNNISSLVSNCVRSGVFVKVKKGTGEQFCGLVPYVSYHSPLVCPFQLVPPLWYSDGRSSRNVYCCSREDS